MSVCSRVKGYARHHERIADLFSLLAVAIFFSSIWFAIDYQQQILDWARENIVLHGSAIILTIVLTVFLIFAFLSIGSVRYTEDGQDDACFQTFRGRRHGGSSLGTAFKNWVDHIEHVNKKHR